MYSKAELFGMATEQPKEIFLHNSIPDDFEWPLDLDAETTRLSHLWDVSRMSMRELVTACNLSQLAFARGACIPPRTVQGWILEERKCPVYLRFLLAEHYGLI